MRIALVLLSVIGLASTVYFGLNAGVVLVDRWPFWAAMPTQLKILSLWAAFPILSLDVACVLLWRELSLTHSLRQKTFD